MKDTIDILDVVALTKDLPERGLYRGQVGTVVESLAPGILGLEFSDDEYRAYASLTQEASRLLNYTTSRWRVARRSSLAVAEAKTYPGSNCTGV